MIKSYFKIIAILNLLWFGTCNAQSETVEVSDFSEVIISPHIQVRFIESKKTSVVIENSKIDREKIKIESSKDKLHIYLEDAKITAKEEKILINGHNQNHSIYRNTEVQITVNYKSLDKVEIRSEERFNFEDAINAEEFKVDIYGSAKVFFESVTAKKLKIAMYGESYLEIKDGKVDYQRYRCYGESEINTIELKSNETKIAAYGNNHAVINVSDKLKVSAFGEAKIQYKGNAKVKNGLKIGENIIQKID